MWAVDWNRNFVISFAPMLAVQMGLFSGVDHDVELAARFHCDAGEDNAVGRNVNGGRRSVDIDGYGGINRNNDFPESFISC